MTGDRNDEAMRIWKRHPPASANPGPLAGGGIVKLYASCEPDLDGPRSRV